MKNKPQTEGKAIEVKQELVPMMGEAERLIAMAIDKNLDVDKFERLVAMRREMKAEWAREEYTKAKAAFQAECPTIQKTKIVYEKNSDKIRYKYAPIESIVEQVKGLLAKNGFSYSIGVNQEGVLLIVSCNVTHKAGHTESYSIPVPIGSEQYMSEVQKYGARITFAKRYAFMDAFGILTGDEDTDAIPEPQQTLLTPRQMAEKKEEGDYTRIPVEESVSAPIAPTNGVTDPYIDKSRAWLMTEVSRLMGRGKIVKDFASLNKATREELIDSLQKAA